MQPPSLSHSTVYERNSVHGYDGKQNEKKYKEQSAAQGDTLTALTINRPITIDNDDSVNNVNKRRRTGDDFLDAILEISDIMTFNQMQPIAHVHIQNSIYEASANNSLVLPHQRHIVNSDKIDNVYNVDDVYNVDNSDNDVGEKEEKKKKKRRGKKQNRDQQRYRQKDRNKALYESS